MPKINCPHCGSRIPDSKTKCPFCRKEIIPAGQTTVPAGSNPFRDIATVIGNHIEKQQEESKKNEPDISTSLNEISGEKKDSDWKKTQRYILNSKPVEIGGNLNTYIVSMIDNMELSHDKKDLLAFANDCRYLLEIRKNLNLNIRSSLLRKYEESILRLEQISPDTPELPLLKVHFRSSSKLGVKNILSFLK